MAGHSHFKNIKRKKESEDKKRSLVFSRMARLIICAVKEKGADPQSNPTLRSVIEKAKEADMPKEKIEKAIKRGSGESDEGKLESFLFEIYGPGASALIIEGSTDNRKRDLEEIKKIIRKHDCKLAGPGSVAWMFEEKGIIEVEKKNISEDIIMEIIEKGAEDFREKDSSLFIYTPKKNIRAIEDFLLQKNIEITSSSPGWKPNSFLDYEEEPLQELIEELQEADFIEKIYTNT